MRTSASAWMNGPFRVSVCDRDRERTEKQEEEEI